MNSISKRKLFGYYATAGFLLALGVTWPFLWPAGFVGVGVFVYSLEQTTTLKKMLLGSYVTWTIKSLAAVFWFWSTYPMKWIDVSLGHAELPVIGLYWLTVALFLGVGGIFFGLCWWYIKKYVSPRVLPVVFAFLWVIGEVVGALGFSIGTLGEGGSINTYFSFGYLGYLFGQHETLLQLAKIAGVYGLSALGALLGYGIWFAFKKLESKKAVGLVFVVALILWGSSGDVSPLEMPADNGQKTVVAIIDTRFGDDWLLVENRNVYKLEQVQQAVQAALALRPDYILLPEDSRFTNTGQGIDRAYNVFRFQSSDPEVVLIDSGRTELKDTDATQRAYVYDGISKKGFIADKQYLVPQGEFMPYFYSLSLQALGFGEVAVKLQDRFTYVPGPAVSQALFKTNIPGILFCFESADPRAVRRLVKERTVPFIAHPISHAWFHESELLWQQQDVMLKMQALWSGVPIVSAANMAKGALYTAEGKKVVPTPKLIGESWEVSLVSW